MRLKFGQFLRPVIWFVDSEIRARGGKFLTHVPELFEIRMRISRRIFSAEGGVPTRTTAAAIVFKLCLYRQCEKRLYEIIGLFQICFSYSMVAKHYKTAVG